jgi:hypothetical protein
VFSFSGNGLCRSGNVISDFGDGFVDNFISLIGVKSLAGKVKELLQLCGQVR